MAAVKTLYCTLVFPTVPRIPCVHRGVHHADKELLQIEIASWLVASERGKNHHREFKTDVKCLLYTCSRPLLFKQRHSVSCKSPFGNWDGVFPVPCGPTWTVSPMGSLKSLRSFPARITWYTSGLLLGFCKRIWNQENKRCETGLRAQFVPRGGGGGGGRDTLLEKIFLRGWGEGTDDTENDGAATKMYLVSGYKCVAWEFIVVSRHCAQRCW